jgi:hypothetical protein
MNNAEYLSLQCQLVLLANLIEPMKLEDLVNRIELAHAAGPVVDPGLYSKAVGHLECFERIARAAREFQKEVAEVRSAGLSPSLNDRR